MKIPTRETILSWWDKKRTRQIVLVLTLVVVGIVTVFVSQAAVPTASFEPENGTRTSNVGIINGNNASGGAAIKFGVTGTSTCGKVIQNYTYQVPYGNAIWNQPICNLPRHPQSADYAARLFQWGHVNDGTAQWDSWNGKISNSPGYPNYNQINPLDNMFSREIYYASKATTTALIYAGSYTSNLDGMNARSNNPNTAIPWNPAWETSQGGDNEMIILDDRPGPTQGRVYHLSGYFTSYPGWPYRRAQPGFCFYPDAQNRLCTYTTNVARDLQGNYVDYRTYEGWSDDRGAGLPYLSTLVTPEEVKAKEIRHAVGVGIPNTAYGPICTTAQQGNYNQEGKTCGTALAPATKFEWGGATSPPLMSPPYNSIYTIDKMIPEGMLFGLDITYDQIEIWLQSRSDLSATRKDTARVFARALKDYGMMVVDTNGSRVGIHQAGGVNPDNAAKWTELGMGPNDPDNMLDGLVTSTNLYVVNPPVATCPGGVTSRYFCQWTSIRYQP